MTRYILFDNCSGYIWGDSADINGRTVIGTPIDIAAAVDASFGEHGRSYSETTWQALAANETGYHVYRVNPDDVEAIPAITDGQDKDMIDLVARRGQYVCTIRCTRPDAREEQPMTHTFRTFSFISSTGRDVTDTDEVAGYRVADYFDFGDADLDIETATDAQLHEAYRGPDPDGVEVRWLTV